VTNYNRDNINFKQDTRKYKWKIYRLSKREVSALKLRERRFLLSDSLFGSSLLVLLVSAKKEIDFSSFPGFGCRMTRNLTVFDAGKGFPISHRKDGPFTALGAKQRIDESVTSRSVLM